MKMALLLVVFLAVSIGQVVAQSQTDLDFSEYKASFPHSNNPQEWQNSLNLTRKIIQKYPKSKMTADAAAHEAFCLLKLGRNEEAVVAADRVINDNPGKQRALIAQLTRGMAIAALGRHQDAIREFWAIDRHCGSQGKRVVYDARREAGKLFVSYETKENYEYALKMLGITADDSSLNAWTHLVRIAAYARQNNWSKTYAILENLKKDYPQESYYIASAEYEIGFFKLEQIESIKDRKNVDDIEIHLKSAQALYDRGTYGAALAVSALARYYMNIKKDHVAALMVLMNAVENTPVSSLSQKIRYQLGSCYSRQGEYAKAAEQYGHLAKSLSLPYSGWVSSARCMQGRCLLEAGLPEESKTILVNAFSSPFTDPKWKALISNDLYEACRLTDDVQQFSLVVSKEMQAAQAKRRSVIEIGNADMLDDLSMRISYYQKLLMNVQNQAGESK